MNKVNHSSSSKVNESKAEQELKEIKITGYGATVTVVNNALQNICNHQLPATHQLLADFSFHSEQVFIQLNTKSEKFLLLPTQSHKITASSRVRQGRVITESAPMLWEEVAQMLSISRKVCITHTDFS
ncbi:hypothetical protein AB0756_40025, partial [Tolypothrix campylonemoides VB511288_2]